MFVKDIDVIYVEVFDMVFDVGVEVFVYDC